MPFTTSIMQMNIKKCPTCGQKFDVIYPGQYAYKREVHDCMRYYCSYSCFRKPFRCVDEARLMFMQACEEFNLTEAIIQVGTAVVMICKFGIDLPSAESALGFRANQHKVVHALKAGCNRNLFKHLEEVMGFEIGQFVSVG